MQLCAERDRAADRAREGAARPQRSRSDGHTATPTPRPADSKRPDRRVACKEEGASSTLIESERQERTPTVADCYSISNSIAASTTSERASPYHSNTTTATGGAETRASRGTLGSSSQVDDDSQGRSCQSTQPSGDRLRHRAWYTNLLLHNKAPCFHTRSLAYC